MTPAQLLRRVGAVNRSAARAEIERALTIVNFGHTRLGDVVQAVTNLRCLKKQLRIRHLDINLPDPAEYRIAAEVLKNDPLVGRCVNLPYGEIPYWEYQAVLHYTVFRECEIARVLAEQYERFLAASPSGIAFYSLPANQWDLENLYGDSWRDFRYPLPLLNAPPDVFLGAIGNHYIYLDAEERAWAASWLAQAGVSPDDGLIVFVDEASVREKVLQPGCSLQVLKHFLSTDGVKVLMYDIRDQGKKDFYRKRLSPELFEKIIFSTRNGLRRDLALLAASNVKMIFGPDTGIMHCASGVHSALVADNPALDAEPPLILVYAGRWMGFNMWNFWSNSSACCVLPYETPFGIILKPLQECPQADKEFQRALQGVSTVTPGLMIDFIESRFGHRLRGSRLLQGA